MKRFVLIPGSAFAVVGAILSGIVLATATSESFPFSFEFGMMVIAPSVFVGRALGLPDGYYNWLWCSLTMGLNTILCFLAGALVGLLVYFVAGGPTQKNEMVG